MGEHAAEFDAVRDSLEQIKRRHRGRIRWHITEHTAELAIAALRRAERDERRRGGKVKRRTRAKRLL